MVILSAPVTCHPGRKKQPLGGQIHSSGREMRSGKAGFEHLLEVVVDSDRFGHFRDGVSESEVSCTTFRGSAKGPMQTLVDTGLKRVYPFVYPTH